MSLLFHIDVINFKKGFKILNFRQKSDSKFAVLLKTDNPISGLLSRISLSAIFI